VQTFRVAECLQQLGLEVEIVAISGAGSLRDHIPENAHVKILQPLWDRVPVVSRLKALRLLVSVVQLWIYLRREKPDVLLSCASKVNLISLAACIGQATSLKTVLTITSEIYHRYPGFAGRRLTPWFIKKLYARADQVLTVSDGLTRAVEGLDAKLVGKTRTIFPPLDLQKIGQLVSERVDHPWFATREIPVVCAVGRISWEKDFETLVRAIAVANESRPLRLVVLGEGDPKEVEKLLDLARTLGIEERVDFLGHEANPYKFMSQSDCFALTSLWEGFGIVLAEALACGCPIVSTDCPHGPREILDVGRYGRLVPVRDPEATARAILESLSSEVVVEVLRGRSRRFGFDQIQKQYQSVFREIAAAS
jgi:glycosyltransferase involved in cell wall biosynthesis